MDCASSANNGRQSALIEDTRENLQRTDVRPLTHAPETGSRNRRQIPSPVFRADARLLTSPTSQCPVNERAWEGLKTYLFVQQRTSSGAVVAVCDCGAVYKCPGLLI